MRDIFKSVAKEAETLIDQAAQANQGAESTDPAKQLSAVDFDAELQRLQGEQQTDPAEDAPAETPPADTPPADTPPADDAAPAEPAAGASPEDAPAPEQDPEQSSEEEQSESEDAEDDDADDADPAAVAEPVPTQADLQKAAEGIARLARCLQSLEEGHETGLVSPEAASIMHGDVDAVIADLNLTVDSAPATETLRKSTENDRFNDLKTRLVKTLRAAWAKFVEWVSKLVRYLQDFRRGYQARKGVYAKTAEGYRARLKALTGEQLPTDLAMDARLTLEDVKLGALSHSNGKHGIQGLADAAALLSSFAVRVVQVCRVDSTAPLTSILRVSEGVDDLSIPDLSAEIQGFDLASLFKITPTSNALIATLADLKSESGDGYLSVSGIPGGLTYKWTYGQPDGYSNLHDAASEIAKTGFSVATEEATTTSDSFEMDTAAVAALLDQYDALSSALNALSGIQAEHDKAFKNMLASSKTMTAVLEKHASGSDMTSAQVQDMVRVFTLLSASYEKAFVRPVTETVRAVSRAQDQLLRIAGNGLVAIDGVLKDAKKAK